MLPPTLILTYKHRCCILPDCSVKSVSAAVDVDSSLGHAAAQRSSGGYETSHLQEISFCCSRFVVVTDFAVLTATPIFPSLVLLVCLLFNIATFTAMH